METKARRARRRRGRGRIRRPQLRRRLQPVESPPMATAKAALSRHCERRVIRPTSQRLPLPQSQARRRLLPLLITRHHTLLAMLMHLTGHRTPVQRCRHHLRRLTTIMLSPATPWADPRASIHQPTMGMTAMRNRRQGRLLTLCRRTTQRSLRSCTAPRMQLRCPTLPHHLARLHWPRPRRRIAIACIARDCHRRPTRLLHPPRCRRFAQHSLAWAASRRRRVTDAEQASGMEETGIDRRQARPILDPSGHSRLSARSNRRH